MSGLSPMMRHYLEIKDKYKDCVIFYRLGDFYEMFFEDAVEVSRLLDLTLRMLAFLDDLPSFGG